MKTKMALGKMMLMLMALVMLLTGCGDKEIKINFAGGDFIKVSETEATKMQEEGIVDGEYNFIVGAGIGISQNELAATEVVSCDVDTSRYYYNQLNEVEQEIYDNLMDSTELFIENQNILCCSYDGKDGIRPKYNDYVTRAVHAYMFDNPLASMWLNSMEIKFDVENVYINGEYSHIGKICLYLTPNNKTGRYADFESPEEARAAIEAVEAETKAFVKTLSGTDEEKYTLIHDWIIEGATYDETASVSNLRSVYGAIIQKNCVCAGFAYAYKYVADVAGLNVLYVTGIGQDDSHAWNHTWVDGTWMLTDVTWDVNPLITMVQSEEPTNEYINEDGVWVREYGFVSIERVNHTYLFADIQDEASRHEHIEEEELGFVYLR